MSEVPRDPWAFQRWAFQTHVGNPVRKAVLSMLAMMADHTTGRCEAKQQTLAAGVEAGERAVRGHLKVLEEHGVIARRAQRRLDGSRRGDEFLLLAPWVTEWPDGEAIRHDLPHAPPGTDQPPPSARTDTPPRVLSVPGKNSHLGTTTWNDHAKGKEEGAREDEFPDDLPEEMYDVAIQAGKILKRTAKARGQKREVTRAAVGHAVLTYPDRDHITVARNVEDWLLHSRGARQPCANIVERYRRFLENSDPVAGPPMPRFANGSVPSTGPGRMLTVAEQLRSQAADLRSKEQR